MSYSNFEGSNGSRDKFLHELRGVKVVIKIASFMITFLMVTRAAPETAVATNNRLNGACERKLIEV